MESLWQEAEPVHAEALGNTGKEHATAIEIRAMHNGEEVAFLFRWEDDTRSDTYRRYLDNGGSSSPTIVGGPDDQFAIKFNLSGSALSCMLAGKDYVDDVWPWKAARTDPSGYAQDRLFIVRRVGDENSGDEESASTGTTYIARNDSPVEIFWKEDSGEPLIVELDPSQAAASEGPAFELKVPTESQADVRAKAKWSEGMWVLEVRRRLDTGYADDVVIGLDKKTKFAIAVFDESEGQAHDNTRWIKLELK